MIETFHSTDQNTSVEIKNDLLWKQTVICFLIPFNSVEMYSFISLNLPHAILSS